MNNLNPLLCVLNEAKACGNDPLFALYKLMTLVCGESEFAHVLAETFWVEANGVPNWLSLRLWCIEFANNPHFDEIMRGLRQAHQAQWDAATDAERAEMLPFIE